MNTVVSMARKDPDVELRAVMEPWPATDLKIVQKVKGAAEIGMGIAVEPTATFMSVTTIGIANI